MNEFINQQLLELNSISKVVANHTLLNQIHFSINSNERVALLGPSGSGKSTLAKIIKGYQSWSSGMIRYQSMHVKDAADLLKNGDIQLVFQNPFESLSPKYKILNLLTEPLCLYKGWRKVDALAWVQEQFDCLKIPNTILSKYPHELSGGEKQKIALLRAISLKPKLLICDEVLSALDILSQKQVLMLLRGLADDSGMSLIFITHDISVIEFICQRAVVLYEGNIVESESIEKILLSPMHEFTKQSKEALCWLNQC